MISETDNVISIRQTDGIVELVDAQLDTWVVRFEPVEVEAQELRSRAVAVGVASGLVQIVPGLRELVGDGAAMRVVFSPEIQRGLVDGTYRMASGGLPMAVDSAGQIAGIARSYGALGGTAVGGLGVGAALTTVWPVVLAAGVATAAAIAQQRWLERTFGGLSDQLDRIETRLRDDDLGVLDATDDLVHLIASVGVSPLPQQLREEVAVARRQVEAIYSSRRRFVERLKATIEREQTGHEEKSGERTAWAGDVAKHLSDSSAVDELVVFIRAMVSRARIAAITAGLLVDEGAAIAALHLVNSVQDSLRTDYWDLQNRLKALATSTPDAPLWKRVVDRSAAERAASHATALSHALETAVGTRVPERDQELAIIVPAGWAAGVA